MCNCRFAHTLNFLLVVFGNIYESRHHSSSMNSIYSFEILMNHPAFYYFVKIFLFSFIDWIMGAHEIFIKKPNDNIIPTNNLT